MSEWYGVRTAVVDETTVPGRRDKRTAPESEVEVPPSEEQTAQE